LRSEARPPEAAVDIDRLTPEGKPRALKAFFRAPVFRPFGRFWLGVRRVLRPYKWRSGFRRLEALRGIGEGRRAFLLGSGPSLAGMDLSVLDGEFVCVANMGVRAIGTVIAHADMHVVTDIYRYQRFAEEMEAIARREAIPHRFVTIKGRRIWRGLAEKANEPIFLVAHLDRLAHVDDRLPPIREGVMKGPSVLLSAAILLEYLGFSPIYVLGCDLDYDSGDKYFYDMKAIDLTHEADPRIIGRRKGLPTIDAHFAVLRRVFERNGHRLVNAGIGGNLNSLPREDFRSLFPERR
jgi:hypothetical protein